MLELKQSATDKIIPFLMVSSTDHNGLSPTVEISKNGGAFASPAGSTSEIGHGWYKLTPNAADTNTLGSLILNASSAGEDLAGLTVLQPNIAYFDYGFAGLQKAHRFRQRRRQDFA